MRRDEHVSLVHTSGTLRESLGAERPDVFNAYQQTQSPKTEKAMTKAVHIASFIGQIASSLEDMLAVILEESLVGPEVGPFRQD